MRVPQWLLQLIAKCLEKDPENRYASGMALQDALFAGSLSTEQPPAVTAHPKDKEAASPDEPSRAEIPPGYAGDDKVHISRPLFFGLAGLFTLTLVTCGYLFYDQKHAQLPAKIVTDTVVKTVPDTAASKPKATDYRRKREIADSIESAAAQQSIINAVNQQKQQQKADSGSTTRDTTVKQPDLNQ